MSIGMDSSAYLTRHGWRGKGHSLHPSGRGIKKPLLVSKKNNVLGLGKKKTGVDADQWWARAFDSSLRSLDIDKRSTHASPISSELGSLGLLRKGGGKWAGLYSAFVKGKGLDATWEVDGKYPARSSHELNSSPLVNSGQLSPSGLCEELQRRDPNKVQEQLMPLLTSTNVKPLIENHDRICSRSPSLVHSPSQTNLEFQSRSQKSPKEHKTSSINKQRRKHLRRQEQSETTPSALGMPSGASEVGQPNIRKYTATGYFEPSDRNDNKVFTRRVEDGTRASKISKRFKKRKFKD